MVAGDDVPPDAETRWIADSPLGVKRITSSRFHAPVPPNDASHNVIVLSRILDRPQTPQLAVEYVLYHEMLHVKHPLRAAAHLTGPRPSTIILIYL